MGNTFFARVAVEIIERQIVFLKRQMILKPVRR